MKLIISLFLLLSLSAFGQGTAIRSLNGIGTNTTFWTGVTLITGQYTGNGLGLTNVLEKNTVVTTNTWGNAVVNFALGTSVSSNMAGNLTITGIGGFVSSNLNWQTIDLNPDGATRTLVIPAEWFQSGFTNATTASITNGTWAVLRVDAIIGRRTNASLEIFQ